MSSLGGSSRNLSGRASRKYVEIHSSRALLPGIPFRSILFFHIILTIMLPSILMPLLLLDYLVKYQYMLEEMISRVEPDIGKLNRILWQYSAKVNISSKLKP